MGWPRGLTCVSELKGLSRLPPKVSPNSLRSGSKFEMEPGAECDLCLPRHNLLTSNHIGDDPLSLCGTCHTVRG